MSNFVGQHPRSIIKPEDVGAICQRVRRDPYKSMMKILYNSLLKQEQTFKAGKADLELIQIMSVNQAYMYLLTGEENWAQKAYKSFSHIFDDEEFFNNPFSKGLTRASLLKSLAYIYDFCYNALDHHQRGTVNKKLYEIMYSVHASMGFESNNDLGSNWMGIRYGSVILGAMVWDNTDGCEEGSPVLPLLWEATRRLRDHVEANLYQNGWNVESMGYHLYGWSATGQAILALNNNFPSSEWASLNYMAPKARKSLWPIFSSTVAIDTIGKKGIKADLSDDNTNVDFQGLLGIAFKLYDEEQKPVIKWMHDYLIDLGTYHEEGGDRGNLIYSILFYPDDLESRNPKILGWRNYVDNDHGAVVFRNTFEDNNDIVATYCATQNRRGHQGPDTNTFRIIGLGAQWVVGAGRTNETAGQTNLFPDWEETLEQGDLKQTGRLEDYMLLGDGSGYAIGHGNCMGTRNHRRFFRVDYSGDSGVPAVFIVWDTSLNGRRWRINTPEYNSVTFDNKGFLIKAPNESTLRGVILDAQYPLKFKTGVVRYGGSTIANNPGIIYNDNRYHNNKWLDCYCDRNITVVMTLAQKGQNHPDVNFDKERKAVTVGESLYFLK